MVTIRTPNELIASLLEFFRLNQPNLDCKPGTVARDLFVEAPSSQIALIYDELSKVSDLQSLRLATGSDLDNLASNYKASRKSAVISSGIAILTFASIPAAIPINKGSFVFSSRGTSFAVSNSLSVSPTFVNLYRAIGTKYRNELDFLGIQDQYAVEVPVSATTPGIIGNIPKFGLNRTSISGVSNVTNVIPFFGGTNAEDDSTFRDRVLSIFSGSNVGTALGYRNAVLSDPQVTDALVIQAGDPLMIRDGTQVVKNSDGTFTIISEGQGGKVDIIILGLRESEYVDSFIYHDKSNKNDPTNIKNIFVLGQIIGDENKTINRRRLDNLANKQVPAQPVDNVTQVTGSLSGANFIPKSVDSLGRISGNYELIKDTGAYAGSVFGFDKFHWIDNHISLFQEDKIKGRDNGQDSTNFSDVLNVSVVKQNISIQNENSSISNLDRSSVKLLHSPCSGVSRVLNLTTGERYTVIDQNPDGTGPINLTGRVLIAGNTLPSPSDVLQVDYTWIVDFDPYVDYDGRFLSNNPRTVKDSIDWGFSNAVRNEQISFALNGLSTFYIGTSQHQINSIVTANVFSQTDGYVAVLTSGIFAGKLAVTVTGLPAGINTVENVVEKNTIESVFNTAQNDGSFSSTQVISFGAPFFTLQIILPTDSPAKAGDTVTVTYNSVDVFTVNGSSGNFSSNQITIPANNYIGGPASFVANVNYIANVQNLISTKLSNIPVAKTGNGFAVNTIAVKSFNNPSITYIKEYQTVTVSGAVASVRMSVSNSEFSLLATQVASIVRISDGVELWNASHVGTVSAGIDGNWLINLTAYNSPASGNNVLVIYSPVDLIRTQPVTFKTNILATAVSSVNGALGSFNVTLTSIPAGIPPTQISITRLSDGVELADAGAIIDFINKKITLSAASQSLVIGAEKVVVVFSSSQVLRQSATRLAATLSDQINNSGILTVKGITITKAKDIIFTATNDGLAQNLYEAVRNFFGQPSNTPANPLLSVGRIVKLENVSLIGTDVIRVNSTYDIKGTNINNYSFYSNETIENTTIDNLNFILPSTSNNLASAPKLGDKLRITFYIVNSSDSEDLFFTRNGTVYGNKFFASLSKVVVSSGFTINSTGNITLTSFNQPVSGTRYKSFYDYVAPKPNERIVVRFNYNKLMGDATLNLEPSRPINADVLLKQAQQVPVNVSLAIVVKPEFLSSSKVVAQNVKDKVISTININKLASIIDSSDLSAVANSIAGVDRVRITGFNADQSIGQVLSLIAQKNQYFASNMITVVVESR